MNTLSSIIEQLHRTDAELALADRAVVEILRETKKGLPSYFQSVHE